MEEALGTPELVLGLIEVGRCFAGLRCADREFLRPRGLLQTQQFGLRGRDRRPLQLQLSLKLPIVEPEEGIAGVHLLTLLDEDFFDQHAHDARGPDPQDGSRSARPAAPAAESSPPGADR